MLEQRYGLQEFPRAIYFWIPAALAISDQWIRAVRQVQELLELFTPSEFDDTDSTGDAEE